MSFDWSVCKFGKSNTLSLPYHGSCATKCFNIMQSDAWDIFPVISPAQYKYFVKFIDDFSRYTLIYFLRSKFEVLSVFQTFVAYIENQLSTCIKILRFDLSGEYVYNNFHEFLKRIWIVSQWSFLILRSKMLWP